MLSPVSPPPDSSEEGKGSAVQQPREEDEDVDISQAMLDDPIVGVEVVISDHRGPGARTAHPRPTPKMMTPE